MKGKLSIQLKALFLLIVFASNTAIGFACAMGVDMGFNPSNQNDVEKATEIHRHADGKKHVHEKEGSVSTDGHHDGIKHEHDSESVKQISVGESQFFNKSAGECCSDDVQKFQNLDKKLNQNANAYIDLSGFVTIVSIFLAIDLSQTNKHFPPKYKSRFFHPPPDIRIAIQSFQI